MCVCLKSVRGAMVMAMLVWGWRRCGCARHVSAGHVGGTRGSCIVKCEMCKCLTRGGVGGKRGDFIRGLGLGLANPVETGGVFYVCLCLGCSGVGGVGAELDKGLEGWGGVMSV